MAKFRLMAKIAACGCLWLCLTCNSFAQSQEPLCPKHVEIPVYPPIARTAHVTGKVVLVLTLDADGKVSDVKVAKEDDKGVRLLKLAAIDNIRLWTFAKPPSAPYTQTIVYDFELVASLPADDGDRSIVKVTFDLPDRVTISANVMTIDHGSGNETPIKKKHWGNDARAKEKSLLEHMLPNRSFRHPTPDGRMTRAGEVVGDKGLEPLTSPV